MLSIGQVLEVLRQAPPDHQVWFDFCRTRPLKVTSWRGSYAEPALTWAEDDGVTTAAALIAQLEGAIATGAVFHGYKGGEYRYEATDLVRVDNWGRCTNTEIHKITFDEYEVLIHTRREGE